MGQPRAARRGLPAGCDVAVLGGGIAGMATAMRVQAAGLSTVVFEAHGHVGGCAGFYRHRGFAFDVGATTLVDFESGGVGAEFLDAVGMPALDGDPLPGYLAWLPDRVVTLHRDQSAWHRERLGKLGDTERHRAFWALLDRLADAFWAASRSGVRLPVRRPADALHDLRAVGLRRLPLARHLSHTLGDALGRFGLREDAALVGLLGMLVEDTVHSSVDRAPLINAALGVTIRGAGLTRHLGGMSGFWRRLVAHYRAQGGDLRVGCRVERVTGHAGAYRVHVSRGMVEAGQVVSALPAVTTARVAAAIGVSSRLRPYLVRDEADLGGAIVVFLGVPEDEVVGQPFTHHQLLQDYARPLGDGNNMFVSVSAPGDLESAPAGHRAVMISTHTELSAWEGLSEAEYQDRKTEIGARLVAYARRAYPGLGARAVIRQVGTPRTYERFTFRPRGAVGGARQTLGNTNQHAIPHQLGPPGFWLVGDSTWPGLGTVACVLGSRIVADGVRQAARRHATGTIVGALS
ncbi:MAG TPA: NAD(P)/FAD-dependent oxidoreductase [Jiangellaceae bacterium]|nr:NAD(P)/FAD-dependent oxidoreductase [Jiangellaceae bacterium]